MKLGVFMTILADLAISSIWEIAALMEVYRQRGSSEQIFET